MTENRKIITKKNILGDLYKRIFINKNVFLKTKELNIAIEFLDYKEDRVYLKITNKEYKFESSVIYVRLDDEVYFSQLNSFSQDNETYVFIPQNIQIIKMPRKEERKKIDSSKPGAGVYISNIITDFFIKECLSHARKNIDYIKSEILEKIEKKFTYVRIFFAHEKSNDLRMKFFNSSRKPLFVEDINNEALIEKRSDNKYYKNSIYPNDSVLINKKYISEISVPMLFRTMIPFGYIQVNSNNPLNNDEFSLLKKLGISTSELLSKDESFIKTSDDKMVITDMSLNGLGVVFKEKVLIKHFKVGSYLSFIIYLPEKKHASVLCNVKNINFIQNSFYKVGCEIENIDPIGEVNYSEFLEEIGVAV